MTDEKMYTLVKALNKMSYEEGKGVLEYEGFWESGSAICEYASSDEIYFENEDGGTIAYITRYSKFEKAEDGSWDTEIDRTYWEAL